MEREDTSTSKIINAPSAELKYEDETTEESEMLQPISDLTVISFENKQVSTVIPETLTTGSPFYSTEVTTERTSETELGE